MNQLLEWLSRIFQSWKFWIVIARWDIGVRVRLGKTATDLRPGFHWRLPFVDEIVLVNTRLRTAPIPGVVKPGATKGTLRTIAAICGYRVHDPLLSLKFYSYPDTMVATYGQAVLAKARDEAEALALMQGEFEARGVHIEYLTYTEDADVRALRLLNTYGAQAPAQGCGPTAPPGFPVSYH